MFEKGQWNAIQKKYEPMDQVCPDMSGSPIEVSGNLYIPSTLNSTDLIVWQLQWIVAAVEY